MARACPDCLDCGLPPAIGLLSFMSASAIELGLEETNPARDGQTGKYLAKNNGRRPRISRALSNRHV